MPEFQGAGDVLMKADASTFRVLPWVPETGWVLCDLSFQDGRPVPYDTRGVLKAALEKLKPHELVCGLEVELHVFKIVGENLRPEDAGQPGNPPDVALLTTGYQLLTENKYDQLDPVFQLIRSNLEKLQLPLRSFEVEFGPSQMEITLSRSRRWPPRMQWCCCAARSSRWRAATAITPPSCAGRSCRT
jgi:glutamine synthetase